MRKRTIILLGSSLIVGIGAAAYFTFVPFAHETAEVSDPRQEPPIVRLVAPAKVTGEERSFTGVVAARVEGSLGFRVAGKVVDRFVDVGHQVKAGQPLMRIDDSDYRLALTAKRNAVTAIKASVTQFRADEARYAKLIKNGWSTRQRYDQAKAALDTAEAQLAAAEAEAQVAENQATYSVLFADADGTVTETLAEPGQVVSAGQPVVRLAQAGPREAVVSLPEMIRPAIGSVAEANIYGGGERRHRARLRQLSDSADAQTRTYEARFALDGAAAAAPLGATVTIRLTNQATEPEVVVPLGALLDDGKRTGVWIVDPARSTVSFRTVKIIRVTGENAVISGVTPQAPIVAIGAHLLNEGGRVRTNSESSGT